MNMLSPSTPRLAREALADWYTRNRARTASLYAMLDADLYEERPLPLRHPFVFYDGHIPAFSFLTLNRRALDEPPIDERFERLFERGIDPASLTDAARHARSDWPTRDAIAAFARACDACVLDAIAHARLEDDRVPRLVRGQAVYTILEHEQMHQETLAYIMHQADPARRRHSGAVHHDASIAPNEFLEIDRGIATLGADSDEIAFGWDNEFPRHEVTVPAFSMQRFPVTNGDWLRFVGEGGETAPFWLERDGTWMLRAFDGEIPLPLSWPVYVTHRQARAYAAWAGVALPTEAQYHRAAFGTPQGIERPFPWGDASPSAAHGNFDFARFDPEPVDAHPAGASAWGVSDLIGNGWEWTSTPFAPFDGFEPMASYPQYSADFFDGKHFVMKGASPVTARELIRRSFRNWFFDDYPYMYAKFRCTGGKV